MDEPFYKTAAIGYDELFARATNSFIPSLLKAARIAPGHRVLDVATGTGAAAQAAAIIVGRSGAVIGGDISPAMLESAKRNLKDQPITLATFDAHALPYEDRRFDAVTCQLGLMFFSDQLGALSEFRRVLRPNGWTAVSVTTTPERSLFARIGAVIARYAPEKAERLNRFFSIPDATCLHNLLHRAGFRKIDVQLETRPIKFASFDDYFSGIAKGATLSGQEYVQLPQDTKRIVREEVWRGLASPGAGEPLTIEMDVLIGSGCH
ncbi:methyltransferase domain-containing protein [Mesorhizobium sp. M0019]|uniref:class I SAM-dependent methyltransferase n=1 Tax=unclassified Mesorhizobium TaxID=325217 RepID=UPI003337452F